jgi:hypothetical protein
MTYQLPSFYDAALQVTRPMDTTATIPPSQVPVSQQPGNLVQLNADGVYVGKHSYFGSFTAFYVSNAGSDTNNGSKAQPFQTIAKAIQAAQSLFPNQQITGSVYIALLAGQTFQFPAADVNIYEGANLCFTFYGDANYGDFDQLVAGTQCKSQYMQDLQRPTVTFSTGQVNAQWVMYGINRNGGSVTFEGVALNLPQAPATPSIALYSIYSDVVRNVDMSTGGYVRLLGSTVNMTDTTAYWGFMGTHAGSLNTSFVQYGSQFLISNKQMTQSNSPTATQLTQRQYFIKMLSGFAGNNQTQGTLQPSSNNSTTQSGIISLSWADTEQLTVTGSKVSQPSFPVMFDINYGFRNYVFGLQSDQQQRALNIQSSRLF